MNVLRKIFVACVLTLPVAAGAGVIDDFEEGPFGPLSAVTPGPSVTLLQTGLPPGNVLGGSRRTYTTLFDGTSTSCGLTLSDGDDGPVLDLPPSSPAVSGNCGFEYGFGANLDVDLTADGADRFRVIISQATPPATVYFGILIESGGTSSQVTTLGPIAPGTYDFPFADFPPGVDFTDVDKITLALVGVAFGEGSTLAVTDFRTFPEIADDDQDGVENAEDACADTLIPESVPSRRLGVNRFALVDDDSSFDSVPSEGTGPGSSYSIQDTAGCSCEQIIDALQLGAGHTEFGCSKGAMDDWITSLPQ